MTFYHDHHNGKLNRFKIRQREYMDTKTSFLEVKFKNNQRRTQHSGYQQIAIANEKTAERLTIDFNLWYSLGEKKNLPT